MDAYDLCDAINGDPTFNVAAIDLAEQALTEEGFDWDDDNAFRCYVDHAQYIGDLIYEHLISDSFFGHYGEVLCDAIYNSVDWFDVGREFFNRAVMRRRNLSVIPRGAL